MWNKTGAKMNGIMQPDLYYTSYAYCPYVPDWATTFFVFSEVMKFFHQDYVLKVTNADIKGINVQSLSGEGEFLHMDG